jgi:hypothetical protein
MVNNALIQQGGSHPAALTASHMTALGTKQDDIAVQHSFRY